MKSIYARLAVVLLLVASVDSGQAQHQTRHGDHAPMPLEEPGNAIFGTVQEAIQALEADPDTDWSKVDMEQLRQHLLDMQQVANHVAVVEKEAIEGGVHLVVEPTVGEARASLKRVLGAHPAMLQQETGWQMDVEQRSGGYALRVTDPQGHAAEKIRGLSYIGLLAYGRHHQQHHWMMVRGQEPHQH